MTSPSVLYEGLRPRIATRALTHTPAGRLLVVEDDQDLRNVFDRIVRSIDPEVIVDWATGVDQAIGCLHAHTYRAIIADYLLQGTRTGLALRAASQRQQPWATFAMMSAYPVQQVLGWSPGTDCLFLPKPFSVLGCRSFLSRVLSPTRH